MLEMQHRCGLCEMREARWRGRSASDLCSSRQSRRGSRAQRTLFCWWSVDFYIIKLPFFFFFSSYPGDGVDVFRGSMVSSVSVSAGVMMDSV